MKTWSESKLDIFFLPTFSLPVQTSCLYTAVTLLQVSILTYLQMSSIIMLNFIETYTNIYEKILKDIHKLLIIGFSEKKKRCRVCEWEENSGCIWLKGNLIFSLNTLICLNYFISIQYQCIILCNSKIML